MKEGCDEWVLGEEVIVWQLLAGEFLLSGKDSLKRSPTTFNGMGRVWLECPIIAAGSWANRDGVHDTASRL